MDTPISQTAMPLAFDNTYARLPERFFARQNPLPVRAPQLIKLNLELAEELGLDAEFLQSEQGIAALAGNMILPGSEPLAMAYAGHQFGGWSPQLGDGRAILLGEVISKDDTRYDIQLKGSGRTPFSRGGDGRAVIGPVLREYIVSEAMHALGVPTTRALAAVSTGELVRREEMEPGAIVTRVARAHIRVGTFQYFAARGDKEALKILADYAIERLYPQLKDVVQPHLALLGEVINAQAHLMAQWMGLGFIHGVMNTDNVSIAGETIDYGPCAFMDNYDPGTVFSAIDQQARYAYANQPQIAHWNLTRFAETLLPLFHSNSDKAIAQAKQKLQHFFSLFQNAWEDVMRAKIGLLQPQDGDRVLLEELLNRMAKNKVDFTLFFRRLCALKYEETEADNLAGELFDNPADFDAWAMAWRKRLSDENSEDATRQQRMRQTNPAFIPRNHLVEEALQAAKNGDYQPFETLNAVLSRPFDDQPDHKEMAEPPRPDQIVQQTFCGT